HRLPAWVHSCSAAAMFAIEGAAPFLIFAPRRARMLAAGALALLQSLIVVTGNYGFFNLLSLALCLLLLDDAAWPVALRRWAGVGAVGAAGEDVDAIAAPGRVGVPAAGEEVDAMAAPGRVGVPAAAAAPRRVRWPRVLTRPVFVVLFVLSLVPLARSFRRPMPWLDPLTEIDREVSPLHVVNPYGLFAVMTTRRLEITIEGSRDGVTWRAYEFRWKPGDARRTPAFMAPHMPRLDWQMWFAALDPQHVPPWFAGLCARLLLGSRPVLGLLASNPFPDAPPRYVRATLDDYRFSTAAERRATGAWWVRTPVGEYVPPVMLEGGRLRLVSPPGSP
ncbi:MAG TPA: lipase maturation factor family protein, partial [Dongiaceae bacterium]|nr:lipase maturation factor family protein [Dongiaceae bacterium]